MNTKPYGLRFDNLRILLAKVKEKYFEMLRIFY